MTPTNLKRLQIIELEEGLKVATWEVYEPELRCWLDNPSFNILENEPCYLLAQIIEADRESKSAQVQVLGAPCSLFVPFSMIHLVHEFDTHKNKLVRVLGEPQ